MDVLAAGVDATNRSQWARVFRNQCDAHGRSHPSTVVLKSRYPAPLRLNAGPCDVLAIVDVQSDARRWAETWEPAWPAKQSAEIAAQYNEAASYRSGPFREAEAGRALAYVERQFAVEEGSGVAQALARTGVEGDLMYDKFPDAEYSDR